MSVPTSTLNAIHSSATLEPVMRKRVYQMAEAVFNDLEDGRELFYELTFENGILLSLPVNGEASVVNLREPGGIIYGFQHQAGSGTDAMRQRHHARTWYEALLESANNSELPFYFLNQAKTPNFFGAMTSFKPVLVEEWRIGKPPKPFINRRNPLSGHDWREAAGPYERKIRSRLENSSTAKSYSRSIAIPRW